jgi:hypothetical protein
MSDRDQADHAAVDSLLVVEAFVDGQAVNAHALMDALAQPAGREHLVELLLLREAVGTMAPLTSSMPGRRPWPRWRSGRWVAAAAGVVLSLTTGFVAGQLTVHGQASPQSAQVVVDAGMSPAAPEPTHVITLRPGVNWTETSGGQ